MLLNESVYWRDTAPALPDYSNKPLPDRADVVVIGSGYTGLSAARTLAMHGAKVCVLEKETISWGASSRNGGQVLTGLRLGPSALIKKVGLARARELYAASLKSMEYVEQLIAAEQIECEYNRVGHIEAAFKPRHFDHFQREQEILARKFDHPIRLLNRSEQRAELGSDYYHGLLIDERSGGLQPAKYVRGLALAAQRLGADLCEKAPALAIRRDGAIFKVATRRGMIIAKDILVATNAYTDDVVPAIHKRVFPVGSFIIATEPLTDEMAAKILPRRRMVFDSKNFLYYFRLSADNRLLFGGQAEFKPAAQDGIGRSAKILRRGLIEVFPELAKVKIEYAWSGNVCFTFDAFPHAGQMEGIYYALGYGGHGVAMATYLGAQIAEVISGVPGANPFADLAFNPIPLYAGRPWFLPLGELWYKFIDMIG